MIPLLLSVYLSSLAKVFTLLSSQEWFVSFRCKWTAESWPEELLSCVVPFVYGELVLYLQCTNLCSPGCTEQHKLHYSVYNWVFLLERVGRFKSEPRYDVYYRPSGVFRCSCDIGNDDVVTFSHLLLSGSVGSFDKGPVWVATGFKCSPMSFYSFPSDLVDVVSAW